MVANGGKIEAGFYTIGYADHAALERWYVGVAV
jgi:hypothetical protein